MANNLAFFERELTLATAGMSHGDISKALAVFAKQELQKAISTGQASTRYERFVNDVMGAPEESVKAPGPIVYVFTNWPVIIRECLMELRKRTPVKSGRYANGFIVLADQVLVTDYNGIRPEAEVIILNPQPYSRKMEVGANKTGKRHFEQSKNALARRYRDVFTFDLKFLNARSGIHPLIPYILKGSQGRRKDRQAGMPITYPAILINQA